MQVASVTPCPPRKTDFEADHVWNQTQWFALYTRSRHEKIVARELSKKGIESFLPIRKIKRHWSDRVKVIEEPLFPGYLFVRIPWRERTRVLKTTGVVNFVVGSSFAPVSVGDREIEVIRKILAEDLPVNPFPYLKEGTRVYVRSGKFKGAEGFVVQKNKQCRLVISLDLLMQSISVELDQACVELI